MINDDASFDDAIDTEPARDPRSLRILAETVALAERGGFAAVRLRDVARASDVALGTVYKRFRSKEDLLVAVINHELEVISRELTTDPVRGTRPERLLAVFTRLTDFLCDRPPFGRAVIRSAATGEKALSSRLNRFNAALAEIVAAAFVAGEGRAAKADEVIVASLLQRLWFALLIGWASEIHDRDQIIAELEQAIDFLLHGIDGPRSAG